MCLWAGSEVMSFLLTSLRFNIYPLIIQQITLQVAPLWHNRCLLARWWYFCSCLQHMNSRRHKDRLAGKPPKPKFTPHSKSLPSSSLVVSHSIKTEQWSPASVNVHARSPRHTFTNKCNITGFTLVAGLLHPCRKWSKFSHACRLTYL